MRIFENDPGPDSRIGFGGDIEAIGHSRRPPVETIRRDDDLRRNSLICQFDFANALVLDTFRFADPGGRFEDEGERRAFQHLVEEATSGRATLPEPPESRADAGSLVPSFDDDAHPQYTRLVVEGPDRFGLLFRLARALSESGCNIEIAYIATPASGVHDEFFLSESGGKLRAETKETLEAKLRLL